MWDPQMPATQGRVPLAEIASHLSSGRGQKRDSLVSPLWSLSEAFSLTQRWKGLSSVAAQPGRHGRPVKGMCCGKKSAWVETPADGGPPAAEVPWLRGRSWDTGGGWVRPWVSGYPKYLAFVHHIQLPCRDRCPSLCLSPLSIVALCRQSSVAGSK